MMYVMVEMSVCMYVVVLMEMVMYFDEMFRGGSYAALKRDDSSISLLVLCFILVV